MILHLVRRNLRSSFALISVLATITLGLMPWTGLIVVAPMLVMMWRLSHVRASAYEAALPIRGRDIFTARVTSILILVWLPLVTWIVAAVIRGHADWPLLRMLEVVAITTLAVILPFGVRARELATPPLWRFAAPMLVLAVASGLTVYLLPPAIALALLAVAVVVTLFATWSAIPEAFQVAPLSANDSRRDSMREVRASSGSRAQWWRPVLRSLVSSSTAFHLAMMILMGALSMSLVYVVIFTAQWFENTRQRARWMLVLPLSHRAMLLILLLPTLVSIPGGLAIGTYLPLLGLLRPEYLGHGAPRLPEGVHSYGSPTNVALTYWWRAPGGEVPVVTAPWGESIEPDTITVLGTRFYNPYTTREARSQRFIDWQFGRVTTAVYGHPVARADYDAGRTTRTDRVTSSPRMQILNAGAILAVVLLLVLVREFAYWYRLGRSRTGHRVALAVILLPPVVVIADMYFLFQHGTMVITPLGEKLLLHLSHTLPNMPAVILVAAASVIGVYALLEWQFGKSEMRERVAPPKA